jgi:predicted alpha/beta-fold hydrolase
VELPDGDALAGRFFAGTSEVLVLVFHGLGGDASAHYVQCTAELAQQRGHSVWTMNHRGCGEGRGLARGTYHSGRGDDLGAVFAEARVRHPGKRLLAIGFSLSGNALLFNLGKHAWAEPDFAISVNPPINLERSAILIKSGLNRLYDLRFVKQCRKAIRERRVDGLLPDHYLTRWYMTLHDFDNAFTAPASGFRDREDYYAQCSAGPLLAAISKPTVILQAKDDPFIPWQDHAGTARSSFIHLHLEEVGGHMGYVSRDAPGRRWLDLAIGHYMDGLLAD